MELITATEAFKKSQENCKNIVIEAIQDAVKCGKTSCTVSDITKSIEDQLIEFGYKVDLRFGATYSFYIIEW